MEDKILVENIRSGDASAFRNLVDEYQVKVLNVSYRFVSNREDAEDITQEVYLGKFYKGDSNLRWVRYFTPGFSYRFF